MVHGKSALKALPVLFVAIAGGALVGCAGAPPQQAEEATAATDAPTASAPPADKPPPSPPPKKDEGAASELSADQKAQMEIALRRGGDKAANCATVVPDGPRGEGEVTVTFDGTIGQITEVTVGAPFAGTPMEACIKRSFLKEYSLRFEGKLEVPYTVKVPGKVEPDKGKGKPGQKGAKDKK